MTARATAVEMGVAAAVAVEICWQCTAVVVTVHSGKTAAVAVL